MPITSLQLAAIILPKKYVANKLNAIAQAWISTPLRTYTRVPFFWQLRR